MKIKDIFVILLMVAICVLLGYAAYTVTHWWEWLFIGAIIVCIGLQTRDYIRFR